MSSGGDDDGGSLLLFLVLVPVMFAVAAPVLLFIALRERSEDLVWPLAITGMATTLAVGVGLLVGLWWAVAMASAVGLGSAILRGRHARGAEDSSEKDEEPRTWRAIS